MWDGCGEEHGSLKNEADEKSDKVIQGKENGINEESERKSKQKKEMLRRLTGEKMESDRSVVPEKTNKKQGSSNYQSWKYPK